MFHFSFDSILCIFFSKMSYKINFLLHHKGRFVWNDEGVLEYVEGEECYRESFETNLMNVWTIHDLCKAWGGYSEF